MASTIPADKLANVIRFWKTLRRIPNYEEVVGLELFNRMFQCIPNSSKLFHGSEAEMSSMLVASAEVPGAHADLFHCQKRLRKHAIQYIKMLDQLISSLGPDTEVPPIDVLLDLGHTNLNLGIVKESNYSALREALICTIQDLLADVTAVGQQTFTEEHKESWFVVFEWVVYHIMRAQAEIRSYTKTYHEVVG